MLRSRSIQQDNLSKKRKMSQKDAAITPQSKTAESPSVNQKKSRKQNVVQPPHTKIMEDNAKYPEEITFFHGVNNGANTLGYQLAQNCQGIRVKHIDEFLSGQYVPPKHVAVWGVLRGGEQIINWAQKNRRNYYYFDNPYLKFVSGKRTFRLTKNESQITQYKNYGVDRMHKGFLPLQPYRVTDPNKSILVCPPGEGMVHYWNLHNWLEHTLRVLQQSTRRQIEVRQKPSPVRVFRKSDGLLDTWEDKNFVQNTESLDSVLARSHAVVTFNSTVAFEALRQGIPVFCSPYCSAALLGNTDIREIENPLLTDRIKLFATLAYSQWTMEELCDDIAWRHT